MSHLSWSFPGQRRTQMPFCYVLCSSMLRRLGAENVVNPLRRYAGVDAVMYVCQYYPQGNVALPEYFTANVMPLI